MTEPTSGDVVVAHKGFAWADVVTLGRTAHGSLPSEGVDAITKMGPFLHGLDDLQAELNEQPGDPMLGPGSVHASTISDGREMSSYPATCHLGVERRTIPGETAQDFTAELEGIDERCRQADPNFQAEINLTFDRQPYSIDACANVLTEVAKTFCA